MRSSSIFVIAVALTSAAFALPTKAAPLSNLDTPLAGASTGLIQKVHGWHYDCEWGLFRYHRHIPGIGNVRCYQDYYRFRRYWDRDYDDDRGYRYRRYYKRHRDYDDNDDYDNSRY